MPLHTIIQSAISRRPQASAIRDLVGLFHRIAIAYLRRKALPGEPDRFGLSLEDLAFDCIAELFRRDGNGMFVSLKQYFESSGAEEMTDDQLLMACRRLVFSKVNQDLYRQYGELDPDLHRILRNIKDSVSWIPIVRIENYGGDPWLVFGRSDPNLPAIPPEFLECCMTEVTRSGMSIRDLLLAAVEIFAGQEIYRRSFPLTGFALLIRASFKNLTTREPESAGTDNALTPDELRRFVLESVEIVSAKMLKGYVTEKGILQGTFERYFLAIREILCNEYVHNDGQERSYYDHLAGLVPGLSRVEYRNNHRTQLEYLAKLTRLDFLQRVRAEF